MSKKIKVTEGSGNVFGDLDMPDAEGELFKGKLMFDIGKRSRDLGLMEHQVAACLGLSQRDARRLMRGRRSGFSTDRLLAMLNRLDLDVDIVVRPTAAGVHVPKVRVIEKRP